MDYVNETTAFPVQRDRYEEGSRAFRGRLQQQDEAQHEKFARALGWFSVGLGLTEMFAPRFLANAIGIRQNHSSLIRMMGIRELGAGIGILSARKPAGWMWARVGGDAIDLALLGAAFRDRPADPKRLGAAVAMVAGVTALDVACAEALTRDEATDSSKRLPFIRQGKSKMRGEYVRYSDDVEEIDDNEQAIFDKIVAVMAKGAAVVREREGRAFRPSHAKPHGLLRGELRVQEGLPEALRQGLFGTARSYPVLVRLSHVPGELLDDRKVSCPRGLAIKAFDVQGEKLPVHEGEVTQDFVLDTGKVFNNSGAKTFLAGITATEQATPMPQGIKQAVSAVSRVTNKALNAVGLNSANLDFYGHPFNHPLAESYFSQAPIRYGNYIAKLCAISDTSALREVAGKKFEPRDENGLRTAVVDFFRTHPAEFDIGIQLCTDLDSMPVENANKEWPEDDSPYQTVARLILPVQDAYSAESAAAIEALSFCPAHSLAAHRPLGSIMRARMHAYEVLGTRRRQQNGDAIREPRNIDEVFGARVHPTA